MKFMICKPKVNNTEDDKKLFDTCLKHPCWRKYISPDKYISYMWDKNTEEYLEDNEPCVSERFKIISKANIMLEML